MSLNSCSAQCPESDKLYEYETLRNNSDRGIGKFSLDVRIDAPISEQQLRTNAAIIKCQNPGYERYYISYFLPSYKLDAGAWATSHYDPDLEVTILALQD